MGGLGSVPGLGRSRGGGHPTIVFLPGESPGKEEPGGLQSMGLQRLGHDWATEHSTARLCHLGHQTYPTGLSFLFCWALFLSFVPLLPILGPFSPLPHTVNSGSKFLSYQWGGSQVPGSPPRMCSETSQPEVVLLDKRTKVQKWIMLSAQDVEEVATVCASCLLELLQRVIKIEWTGLPWWFSG